MSFNDYSDVERMFSQGNFRGAYNELNSFSDRDAHWYYLRGVCSMNLGYYDEGQDCIKRAKYMEPGERLYQEAYDNYINRRNTYDRNAQQYNMDRNNMDNSGCYMGCCPCPCLCGGDCCDTLCTLWCCDSCCECGGGDLITCC